MDETVTDAPEVLEARVIEPMPANLTTSQRKNHDSMGEMGALEDDIYNQAFEVIKDVLSFRDIDPEDQASKGGIIDGWVSAGMSRDDAEKRWRLAMAGWDKSSEAPSGVALAERTFAAITKARSKQPTTHIHLAASFVLLPTPQVYPEQLERDVDDA